MKINLGKVIADDGRYRIREGYLFFPKIINHELRWLTKATWEEKYHHVEAYGCQSYSWWERTRWLDKK